MMMFPSHPPRIVCTRVLYVWGPVRECSDRVYACACDLWADFWCAFVVVNKQMQTKRTAAPKLHCHTGKRSPV